MGLEASCSLVRKDLPLGDQHRPDDLPHHLRADAEQVGDGRVGVVEAVKQHLGHLPLLLPVEMRVSFGLDPGIIRSGKDVPRY